MPLNPLCFFLFFRCPPRFTLFPYTTLFRSLRRVGEVLRALHAVRHHPQVVVGVLEHGAVVDEQAVLDRKSTRLNSSHRCISYAVFCLKKKTTTLKLFVKSTWSTAIWLKMMA